MTGQNDRQDRSLAGQVRDQARHCLLTGRYLQPCKPIMHWSSNIKVAALKAGLANLEYSKKQKRLMFNYRTVGPSGLKT